MKQSGFAWAVLVFWVLMGVANPVAGTQNPGSGFHVAALSGETPALASGGNWYVTEKGYIAALEEDLLDEAIFWAGLGNEREFEDFIHSSPLVFPLKGGVRVYLEAFSYCGKVKIRPAGSTVSVWTVREAIRTEVLQ